MRKLSQITLAACAALVAAAAAPAHAQVSGKKVLFVNSYHAGYPWSDAEERGAKLALQSSGVQLQFARMDAKEKNTTDASRKAVAASIKAEIEAVKPDVVIVADDVAVKYVLQPSFLNSATPFVFAGVNWDATKYGLPARNVTGMLEVAPVKELVANLKAYAKGGRVGYLTVDSETERIEAPAYAKVIGAPFAAQAFVKSFADWQKAFVEMQSQVDVVLLGNNAGLADWNDAAARAFVAANVKVPVGCAYDYLMPYAMLGLTKLGEEQGAWAGAAALRILHGEAPSSIPIASNKQSKILINPKLAAVAGVVFRPELVRVAQVVQ